MVGTRAIRRSRSKDGDASRFARFSRLGDAVVPVGTRSRAIRRRTSNKGAKVGKVLANGKELQLRKRKSAYAEAPKRSVETWCAGRAGAHLPAPERLGPIISSVHTNDLTLTRNKGLFGSSC